MPLGDIIAIEGIQDYVIKVPNDGNDSGKHPLRPGPGTFVSIKMEAHKIIGVVVGIKATIKEDFLPYISPDKQPRYMPYNEDYRNCYLEVRALGTLGLQDASCSPEDADIPRYRVCQAPEIKDSVGLATPVEIEKFHTRDGEPSLAYLDSNRAALPKEAISGLFESLEESLPGIHPNRLLTIRRYLEREAKN